MLGRSNTSKRLTIAQTNPNAHRSHTCSLLFPIRFVFFFHKSERPLTHFQSHTRRDNYSPWATDWKGCTHSHAEPVAPLICIWHAPKLLHMYMVVFPRNLPLANHFGTVIQYCMNDLYLQYPLVRFGGNSVCRYVLISAPLAEQMPRTGHCGSLSAAWNLMNSYLLPLLDTISTYKTYLHCPLHCRIIAMLPLGQWKVLKQNDIGKETKRGREPCSRFIWIIWTSHCHTLANGMQLAKNLSVFD